MPGIDKQIKDVEVVLQTKDSQSASRDSLRKLAFEMVAESKEGTYELRKCGDSYLLVPPIMNLRLVEKSHICLDFLVLKAGYSTEIVFSNILPYGSSGTTKSVKYRESISMALFGYHDALVLRLGDVIRIELRDVSRFGFDFRLSVNQVASKWHPFPCDPRNMHVGLRCVPNSCSSLWTVPESASKPPFGCFDGGDALAHQEWLMKELPECLICCCQERNLAVLIPCHHMICVDCIQKVNACPCCRKEIRRYVECKKRVRRCAFPGCGCDQMNIVACPCNCLVGCKEGAKAYKGSTCPICCRWVQRYATVHL